MEPAMNQIEVTLRDDSEEQIRTVRIRIDCRNTGINICPVGYGDASSEPGFGAPIFLELHQGELRLVVWSDINSEEPTHVISLDGAKEEFRNEAIGVG